MLHMLFAAQFFTRALNQCMVLVAYTILLLALWMGALGPAEAQPSVGAIFKDHLSLGSGASTPLPPGQWQLTKTATIARLGFNWEVMVLKNTSRDAEIPFMVVGQMPLSLKWGSTACTFDASNANHFLVNLHGTLPNGLINKCSRVFQIGNISQWLTSTATQSDWWSPLIPGFDDLGSYQNKSLLMADLRVQKYNARGIQINLFIAPPKGAGTGRFREDAKAGLLTPNHEILSNWLAILIESVEQSFLNKKPVPLLALQFQGGSDANLAAAPVQPVAPSKPLEATQTTPALNASTVNNASPSAVESQNLAKERQAIELEKQSLAQQLEKMREMLAQLQQANAIAVAQATKTETTQPVTSQSKPAQIFANRKALVIGNDLYTDVPKLNNAGTDAEAMAKTLETVGFKVWKHLNLDEKKFKQALRDFRQQVQGGDEVLVFYAGHGVQLGNANYLLPVDIKGDHEEQIKDEAIQLQRVLDDLQDKKTKFALAVIDACRDNPFKGQGRAIGGRGLAPTTAATGQMIIFSAGSGQQALDKLGQNDTEKNGLFTRVFIKEMIKPGISVDRVLRNVRNEVVNLAKSVGHEQTPALYDQAIGEFYFRQ